MIPSRLSLVFRTSLVVLSVFLLSACGKTEPVSDAKLKEQVGKLPLAFQENKGQTDAVVKYLVKNGSMTIYFTQQEVVYNMIKREIKANSVKDRIDKSSKKTPEEEAPPETHVIRQSFVGANQAPEITSEDELPGKINYLIGSDQSKWLRGLSTYAKVHYADLYPGIDLLYSGVSSQLNYRYDVDAGSDRNLIRVKFSGVDSMEMDKGGNLVLKSSFDNILVKKPSAYQQNGTVKQAVVCNYKILDNSTYSFEMGKMDPTLPLVIETE